MYSEVKRGKLCLQDGPSEYAIPFLVVGGLAGP